MCYIKTKVTCPHCQDSKVVKNGKKRTGKQNFKCNKCLKQFQYEYQYRGADPKIREQLKRSLLHGSGIRDCSHIYGVSTAAVLRLILRLGQNLQIRPRRKHHTRVLIDELYSFVEHKGKKVWIFYAYAPQTKEILAVTMGKRNVRQLKYLQLKIKHLNIQVDVFCTDSFERFQAILPSEKHLIGKIYTKAIEGKNTGLRAKIPRLQRRTTKFSKKLIFHWYLFLLYVSYSNELFSSYF